MDLPKEGRGEEKKGGNHEITTLALGEIKQRTMYASDLGTVLQGINSASHGGGFDNVTFATTERK